MSRILAILGKSASGKDTLLHMLRETCGFLPVIPCTTRPMRDGETDGVDYYFLSREDFFLRKEHGDFLETRCYHTIKNGIPDDWFYGTLRESFPADAGGDYAIVVDLDALQALRDAFGARVTSLYLDVPEPVRRSRCSSRGDFSLPEWERREADDEKKYLEEVLADVIDIRIIPKPDEDPISLFNRLRGILGI